MQSVQKLLAENLLLLAKVLHLPTGQDSTVGVVQQQSHIHNVFRVHLAMGKDGDSNLEAVEPADSTPTRRDDLWN